MSQTFKVCLRRIGSTLALLVFVGVSNVAANVTSLRLNSEPGDYVGGGQQLFFGAAGATFGLDLGFLGPVVALKVEAPGHRWFLQFAAPYAGQLTVGVYSGAARFPFHASQPGLSVSGNSRACNTVTGSFEVKEAVYGVDNQVVYILGHVRAALRRSRPGASRRNSVQRARADRAERPTRVWRRR